MSNQKYRIYVVFRKLYYVTEMAMNEWFEKIKINLFKSVTFEWN